MAKMGEDFFLRTNSKINGEAATKKWVMNVINRVERRKKKKKEKKILSNQFICVIFDNHLFIRISNKKKKKKKIRKRIKFKKLSKNGGKDQRNGIGKRDACAVRRKAKGKGKEGTRRRERERKKIKKRAEEASERNNERLEEGGEGEDGAGMASLGRWEGGGRGNKERRRK